ncbi:unnamed protein product [Paramecium sonneborni]|uniref:Ubiquitin-like protease family profile domain-containing protein n=1 Tax=Paramecium sonneborni TaxID=65129 RepID=A0A8S1M1W0_9CILI|nr:unnamed protein product [Paramecium sonneborni]
MLKQIDNRKNGVTIDKEFIQILENHQYLTSPHLIFFQQVFYKYFSNRRNVFLVDCYFFAEFMPKLTSQLPSNLIDIQKLNKIKQQIDDKKLNENYLTSKSLIQTKDQKNQQIQQNSSVPENQKKQFQFEILSVNQDKQVDEGIFKMSKLESLLSSQSLNKNYQKGDSLIKYDYAYFPINLGNYHWISVLVYFREGIIIYQDSLNGYNADIIAGVERILKYKNTQKIDWKIQKNSPRQFGTSDCGVFALYALFFLYTRGELIKSDSYSQTFITRVRQNFATLAKAELIQNLNAEQVLNIVNKQ